MWEYAITIFAQYFACKIYENYENFLVLTIWIYQLYHYIVLKSVAFQFLKWNPQIVAKIYFSNHSHCLLLLSTQCVFVICSLYRIETLAMPFNFQHTIFSIKMRYNRPCKYSRPWNEMKMVLHNVTSHNDKIIVNYFSRL